MNAEPSGLEPIVIQTERLILRRLTMDDLEAPAALYGDPEVRRYFPDGTRTYEQTREELEWVIDVYYGQYGYGLWGRRSSGRPAPSSAAAGCCPGRSRAGTEVEVAYLLNRNYWARGLATEAARAIVDYAFTTLLAERLICMLDPENSASRSVAAKAGMSLLWDDHVGKYGLSHVSAIQRPLPDTASVIRA